MSKKIKLTESQLKSLMSVINEDTYDQALTTHQREKAREVFMSTEEAKLLGKLSSQWCETRVSDAECEELSELLRKLKIDRML